MKPHWRIIEVAATDVWSINLRDVANIVGFATYPVGWRWDEYGPNQRLKERDYEAKIKNTGKLGIPDPIELSDGGFASIEIGRTSRREAVFRKIQRMIIRKEIEVVLTDEHMQGHVLGDRLRLDETMRISIEKNAVGFNDLGSGDAWAFSTDTLELLQALEKQRKWKRNASKHDWLVLERLARLLFESKGVPTVLERFSGDLTQLYLVNAPESIEPSRTDVLKMLSQLKSEYSSSEI